MACPPCGDPIDYSSYVGASTSADAGGRPQSTAFNQYSSRSSPGSSTYGAVKQNYDSFVLDPDLDGLLCALQTAEDRDQIKDSAAPRLSQLGIKHNVVNVINHDSAGGGFNIYGTRPAPASPAAGQTVCKVQPRVYERSPSRIVTYNPPPNCKVVHLQCVRQPSAADPGGPPGLLNISVPSMPAQPVIHTDMAAAVVPGLNMPVLRPPPTATNLGPRSFIACSNMQPPHPRPRPLTDLASQIINNMPANQASPIDNIHPPAYANLYSCSTQVQQAGVGAYSHRSNLESNQGILDPEHCFSFHQPPPKEINPSWNTAIQGDAAIIAASSQNNLPAETMNIGHNHISYNQADPHQLSKLTTCPRTQLMMGSAYSDQQKSMAQGLSGVNICGSRMSCPLSRAGGTSSPDYMQSSYSTGAVSDSAAMEISSMHATNWSETNSEGRSVSVPESPTPSVNERNIACYTDHGGAASNYNQQKIKDRISSCDHDVAFRVKTGILDLYDGFSWRKYGEKAIKKTIHRRSYYRCERSTQSGCKVVKRTQKCPLDDEYVVFTYLGRHNHHP